MQRRRHADVSAGTSLVSAGDSDAVILWQVEQVDPEQVDPLLFAYRVFEVSHPHRC